MPVKKRGFHPTLIQREKYKIEAKDQHKKVLDNIVEQKAKGELVNKGKAIRDAGYSEATAHNPSTVIKTQGFQQLLQEKITDQQLVDYLAADLQEKEGNRLGELKLAFELKGELTNKVDVNVNQEVDKQLIVMKGIIDNAKDKDE